MRRVYRNTAILFILMSPITAYTQTQDPVQAVTENIMCMCGTCTDILSECMCETAGAMTDEIEGYVAAGMLPQDIIDVYVGRYGESVLASPSKEGFNRLAWAFPMIAFGLGLVIVTTITKRWTTRGSEAGQPQATGGTNLDTDFTAQVDQEMKDLGI